jgi:hypothetical protein
MIHHHRYSSVRLHARGFLESESATAPNLQQPGGVCDQEEWVLELSRRVRQGLEHAPVADADHRG